MLSAMDGNKQEEKLLVVERKSLKWAKANNAPALKITLMSPHSRWDDCDITFTITMIVKQRIFKCIKCMNKGNELYDVPCQGCLGYHCPVIKFLFSSTFPSHIGSIYMWKYVIIFFLIFNRILYH